MDIDNNNNNNNNNNTFHSYLLPSTTVTSPPSYLPSSYVGGFNNNGVQQQQPSNLSSLQSNMFSPQQPQPQQQQAQLPVFGLIIPGCPVRTDFIPIVDNNNNNSNPSILLQPPPTKYSLNLSCTNDLNHIPLLSITELVLFVTTSAPSIPGTTSSIIPACCIPPEYGVLCYWQITESSSSSSLQFQPGHAPPLPESTGFALLGALTSTQPSTLYRTGWSEQEQLVNMVQKLISSTSSSSNNNNNNTNDLILTIGLSIEPIQNVHNILGNSNNIVTPVTLSLPTSPTTSSSSFFPSPQDVGSIMNQTIRNQTMTKGLYVAQKIALDLLHFMQSFDTPTTAHGSNNNNNMMTVPTNIFDRWYQRFENRYKRDPNFFMKPSD